MISTYNTVINTQTFEHWLIEVRDELAQLGHCQELSAQERYWFYHTWDNYDLSPAEAAQSFINET